MIRGKRQISMAAAAAAAALALTGCDAIGERAAEEVVERASDGDVDIDSDSGEVTIEDDDGGTATMGVGTDVPAEFTDAMALPDGFQAASVTEIEDDGESGISVIGTVESGSIADLVAQIDATVSDGGWAPVEGTGMNSLYDDVEERDARMVGRGDETLSVTIVSEDAAAGPHQLTAMWLRNGDS